MTISYRNQPIEGTGAPYHTQMGHISSNNSTRLLQNQKCVWVAHLIQLIWLKPYKYVCVLISNMVVVLDNQKQS
jgi:hypothetical protein